MNRESYYARIAGHYASRAEQTASRHTPAAFVPDTSRHIFAITPAAA